MEDIAKTAAEAAGQMSQATMLWIMGALVTVITTLGGIVTAQYNKRTNPINGTLVTLNTTLREVNTTLTKVDVRAEAASVEQAANRRVLERHTEKLISLTLNEAAQTKALLELGPTINDAMTGCTNRLTGHCNERSGAILDALDKQ